MFTLFVFCLYWRLLYQNTNIVNIIRCNMTSVRISLGKFPFSALTLLVERHEAASACKNVGCWFDWSFACLIVPVVTITSLVLSTNKKLSYRWQPCDEFRGQSRSPNMIPFHILGMVSYECAIITLFLVSDIRLQKCRDLEIRVRCHSRSLKVVPFDRLGMVSY